MHACMRALAGAQASVHAQFSLPFPLTHQNDFVLRLLLDKIDGFLGPRNSEASLMVLNTVMVFSLEVQSPRILRCPDPRSHACRHAQTRACTHARSCSRTDRCACTFPIPIRTPIPTHPPDFVQLIRVFCWFVLKLFPAVCIAITPPIGGHYVQCWQACKVWRFFCG